jgi:hypothetical protein
MLRQIVYGRIRHCIAYKCVPAKRGQSPGCPPGHVKRCAKYAPGPG